VRRFTARGICVSAGQSAADGPDWASWSTCSESLALFWPYKTARDAAVLRAPPRRRENNSSPAITPGGGGGKTASGRCAATVPASSLTSSGVSAHQVVADQDLLAPSWTRSLQVGVGVQRAYGRINLAVRAAAQCMIQPADTLIAWPVMPRPSSEAKYRTIVATSPGSSIRFCGTNAR
jgi:hypothetical protein